MIVYRCRTQAPALQGHHRWVPVDHPADHRLPQPPLGALQLQLEEHYGTKLQHLLQQQYVQVGVAAAYEQVGVAAAAAAVGLVPPVR